MTTTHTITENGVTKSFTCDALENLPGPQLEELAASGNLRPSLYECGNHFVEAPDYPPAS